MVVLWFAAAPLFEGSGQVWLHTSESDLRFLLPDRFRGRFLWAPPTPNPRPRVFRYRSELGTALSGGHAKTSVHLSLIRSCPVPLIYLFSIEFLLLFPSFQFHTYFVPIFPDGFPHRP